MYTKKLLAAALLLAGVAVVVSFRPAPPNPDADVVVYKSPTCGCCVKWIDHLEEAGYTVRAENVVDMVSVKQREGVPMDLSSCHTAIIGDYVFEGHIPARVISDFLEEGPDLAGLAVPGMPIGSPGMEGWNPAPYDVIAFDGDGNRGVFERIEP